MVKSKATLLLVSLICFTFLLANQTTSAAYWHYIYPNGYTIHYGTRGYGGYNAVTHDDGVVFRLNLGVIWVIPFISWYFWGDIEFSYQSAYGGTASDAKVLFEISANGIIDVNMFAWDYDNSEWDLIESFSNGFGFDDEVNLEPEHYPKFGDTYKAKLRLHIESAVTPYSWRAGYVLIDQLVPYLYFA